MSNNKRNSLEDEFRSSQVYRKISKSGGDIANILADGIGKATKVVDSAIDKVGNVVNSVDNSFDHRRRYSGQHPYSSQQIGRAHV